MNPNVLSFQGLPYDTSVMVDPFYKSFQQICPAEVYDWRQLQTNGYKCKLIHQLIKFSG